MSGVRIPANAAARDVRRMREENLDLEEQILVLRTKQLENSEMMGQLSHIAEWVDEQPDIPVEGPEPEAPVEGTEPEEVQP